MVKNFKSVGMLLFFLLGATGTMNAALPPSIDNVQQQGACSGVVKDATGEPVIGASVIVKGTTNGTITDFDGNFNLSGVDKGATLVVSFVGYKTIEVKYAGTPLNVTLQEDSEMLEEVVITGYGGSQKRAAMTTAISKMDNKVLETAAFSNAGQALQGTVTGLRVINTSGSPGATPNIVLRGGASISGSSNALVIVDGVVRNSMADVNAEDIESMQVLKDAASTAIYGARANGGVILIETKSGKKGKASVNYKFKIGVNKNHYAYDYIGTEDYLYYNRMGMKRVNDAVAGYSSGYNPDSQQGYGTQNALYDVRYLDADSQHYLNEGWQKMTDPYSGKELVFKDHSGQLKDAVFQDATTMEHYLNINGGNDKGTFAASLGYYEQEGTIRLTKYNRFTGNLSGSYQVLPFLKVKAATQLMWSHSPSLYTSDYNIMYRTLSARATWDPWDADGNPKAGFGSSDGNYLYWANKYHNKNGTYKTTFNVGATADIIKNHLTLDYNASLLLYNYNSEGAWDAYKQDNQSAYNTTRSMSRTMQRYNQFQTNAVLNYKNTWADAHDLNVMLGGEYYDYSYDEFTASAHGAPTDDIHTMNVAPERDGISTSKTGYRILSAFGRAEYNYKMRYLLALTARYDGISRLKDHRWGFFPGVSAGWNVTQEAWWEDSKLSNIFTTLKPRLSYGTNGNVSGLGNYEIYGAFGTTTMYNGATAIVNSGLLNTGLRWEESHTFEVGLDLGFFDNRLSFILDYYNRETKDLLTNLSLPGYTGFSSIRTNYGNLRNQGFEAEVRANIINKGGFTWDVTANVTTVSNKILKLPANGNPNNRVGGYEVAAGPATQGADGKWQYNTKWVAGNQEGGKLGEIVAYQQDHIYKDWADVQAHSNTTVDQVGKLYGPALANQINPATGKTYKESSNWKPIEPGDVCWEDMDGDGQITTYDQKVIGNALPNITGGFSTTLGYKGISLYARFDYSLGHTIYNGYLARVLGQYQGTFNLVDEVYKMWNDDRGVTDTDLPKFYYADQLAKYNITRGNNAGYNLSGNNSRFYSKADYMACRELTLSYKLPKSILSYAKMSEASIYVTGQNLFYVTGYKGNSPEAVVAGGAGGYVGVDDGRWTTPRSFLFGLSLTF